MRPAGEVRRALADAVQAIVAQRGHAVFIEGFTHVELAAQAQVGFSLARRTVDNMRRAGELKSLGVRPVPGCNRGMARFAPVRTTDDTVLARLDDLLRCWSRRR